MQNFRIEPVVALKINLVDGRKLLDDHNQTIALGHQLNALKQARVLQPLKPVIHTGRRDGLASRQVNKTKDRGIFDALVTLDLKAGELEGLRLGRARNDPSC